MGGQIRPKCEDHHLAPGKYDLSILPLFHPPLAQMHQYRAQKLSLAAVAAARPVHPTPVATGGPPSTRFKVQRLVYEKRTSPQESTVEAEFRKYTSGETSSEETDILQFWEVRTFLIFELYYNFLDRPTGRSSRRCSH